MECRNCGAALPDEARFCPQCGVRVTVAPAGTQDPGAERASAWDYCEIRWWRGYLKADFYAHVFTENGGGLDIARSPTFWWRRDEQPAPVDAALVAHVTLVRALVDSGWEPFGEATPWYARRFRRRRVLGAPPFVALAPPDSTAAG